MNFDDAFSKAIAATGISAAVMIGTYYTRSAWCLWALWFVVFLYLFE